RRPPAKQDHAQTPATARAVQPHRRVAGRAVLRGAAPRHPHSPSRDARPEPGAGHGPAVRRDRPERGRPGRAGLSRCTLAAWIAPERALASIRSANTAGDREWILQNFPPDEQAHIRPLLDDAALVKRNQEHYRAILGLEITGSAELRGYIVLLTREELGEGR